MAGLSFRFDKILIRIGATHINPRWRLTPKALGEAAQSTANTSILVIPSSSRLPFSRSCSYNLADRITADCLAGIGGGKIGFVIVAMIVVFLLGINLEFPEITFIVVPIFLPAMEALGFTKIQEKIWFTVMMAVNLNMAFISPPVGFSLFYLQSVAPPEVKTADIHKGALPFMVLQGVALVILAAFPGVVEFSHDLFVAANFHRTDK